MFRWIRRAPIFWLFRRRPRPAIRSQVIQQEAKRKPTKRFPCRDVQVWVWLNPNADESLHMKFTIAKLDPKNGNWLKSFELSDLEAIMVALEDAIDWANSERTIPVTTK